MKKILLVFSAIILVIGAIAYSSYTSNYKKSSYYVRVPKDNNLINERKVNTKDRKAVQYTYLLKGFDVKGKSKDLKYTTLYKLTPNSYLEVFTNSKNEVVTSVEWKRYQIPKNALKHLN